MSKIKINDLLNMINKGEELPKKIKYWNKIWELDYDDGCYFYAESDGITLLLEIIVSTRQLNDEVEVLEEEKKPVISKLYINNELQYDLEEKKIPEKITMRAGMVGSIDNKLENLNINTMAVEDKINEIIDYLKSKGDE